MGVKDTANLAMIPAAYAENKVYSVLPSDGNGDFTFTRTGSGTRINKGGYIETMGNNVPRLNYRLDADGNPTGCAELLLEQTRLNRVYPNNTLSGYSILNATVSNNNSISPDGANNASLITSGSGGFTIGVFRGFSCIGGNYHNFSVFLKKGTYDRIKVQEGFASAYMVVNLTTGTEVSSQNASNKKVEAYPNDWYRVSFDFISASNGNLQYALFVDGTTSTGITFYAFGGQIEQGIGATSLINTTSGIATRNEDNAYNQPFGDLASDYPITAYWKGRITNYNVNNTGFSIYQNGYSSRYLMITFNSSSQLLLRRRDSGGEDLDYINYTTQIGDVKKIAIKFTSNTSAKVFVDGLEVLNLSGGTDIDYSYDCVNIGTRSIAGDTNLRNPADELFVWNKALTDAEMVEITTP